MLVAGGQCYRFGDIAEGFAANQEFLWQQWLQIRKLPTYLDTNAAAAHWDNMTVAELFDEHLPFGSNTPWTGVSRSENSTRTRAILLQR